MPSFPTLYGKEKIMNRLILYRDLEENELVLLCTSQSFYDGVFKTEPRIEVVKEIDIDGDLTDFPTNCSLTADF